MAKTIMQQLLEEQKNSTANPQNTESAVEPSVIFRNPVISRPTINPAPPEEKKPSDAYDALSDDLRMIEEDKNNKLRMVRKQKTKEYIEKGFQILLVILCVYLVFLIYGALNTNYVYDKNTGSVVPLVVPVESIRQKAEYEVVTTQYLQARTLYEEVLKLDYRLGMASSTGEDPLLIAPEYEKILEKISSLSVQMSAQTVPAQYTQPYNMLLNWVKNDIALYNQYVSRAITQNSVADMTQALTYKDSMYTNFMRITEIIATLGSQVDNVDTSIIYNWSPESYIQQYSGGI